jgi:hypothetical protein
LPLSTKIYLSALPVAEGVYQGGMEWREIECDVKNKIYYRIKKLLLEKP